MPETTALPDVEDMGWYDRTGPADGPAVVLLHPSELNRKLWLPQVAALQDEFRLIAPDLPGHGALREEPFALDPAMTRLRQVIDEEANGRAVVVGLSLGGYAAMALAGRHPDHVAGLVLSGCSWRLRGPFGFGLRAYAWAAERLSPCVLPSASSLELRLRRPGLVAQTILNAGLNRLAIPQALTALARRDPFADLMGYTGPVLLLNGRWDVVFRQDERGLLAALPNAGLEVLPAAGHLASLGQPEAFSEAVRRFRRSVTP